MQSGIELGGKEALCRRCHQQACQKQCLPNIRFRRRKRMPGIYPSESGLGC